MRRVTPPVLPVLSIIALLAVMSSPAMAQSGTRRTPPSGSSSRAAAPDGSGLRTQARSPLALEGYCPVSLKMMNQWVQGDPSLQTVFDGHTYYFANQQGKQMFSADPAKYVPALGGDCVVSLVKMGKRFPGNIRHAAFNGKRLFLFANEDGKKMFVSNPQAYTNADLAYGGNCVVCNRNMKQTMPGRPEIEVIHRGLRYRFASVDQRNEFLSNPTKYEVAATKASTPPRGSGSRQPVSSGSGSR